ncbi:hypothetical protein Gotur_016622, partial [Gossypium turneri]
DQVESVLGILLLNPVQKDVVWRGDSFGVYTKIKVEALCPVCNEADETVAHLFRDCKFTSWLLPSGVYGTTGIELTTMASGKQYKRWWLKNAIAGIIIRNEAGLVMGSCVCPWDNVPTTAEAIACLQAVNFAEDLGFREVGIEGDALTWSIFGYLIADEDEMGRRVLKKLAEEKEEDKEKKERKENKKE